MIVSLPHARVFVRVAALSELKKDDKKTSHLALQRVAVLCRVHLCIVVRAFSLGSAYCATLPFLHVRARRLLHVQRANGSAPLSQRPCLAPACPCPHILVNCLLWVHEGGPSARVKRAFGRQPALNEEPPRLALTHVRQP